MEEGAELINDPNSPVACFIDNVNNDDSVYVQVLHCTNKTIE